MKRILTTVLVGALMFVAGVAYAQHRHQNLTSAQRDISAAWQHISAAQDAHEFDLDGHAQKAKEALDVAQKEVKRALDTLK